MHEVSPAYEVLIGSRRKQVRLLVFGLFLVTGSAIAGSSGSVIGWFGVVFFGSGVVLAAMSLVRPARLEIGPDGFRSVQLGRRRSELFEWRHCRNFQLFSPTAGVIPWSSRRSALVAFDYDSTRHSMAKTLGRSLVGVECALPDTYGLTASALRDLLMSRHWQAIHRATWGPRAPD